MINKTISFCGMLLVCINVCIYISYLEWFIIPLERLPKPRWFVFYSVFPFAISFANLSRCGVFLSRHPCVWNALSRTFAENPEKNPLCSLANTYWNTCSPPAMWESLDFIRAPCRPSPLLLLFLLHLLVLHPTLNRQLQISVGTAGPQPHELWIPYEFFRHQRVALRLIEWYEVFEKTKIKITTTR